MREEDLENAILEKDKTVTKEQLDKLVEEKLRNSPFLTRRGALLIILEEKRLAKELLEFGEFGEYLPVARLISGLQSVNVAGRVLGIRTIDTESGRKYVKLRIGDGSGSVDVFADSEAFTGLSVGDVIGLRNCGVFSLRRRKTLALRANPKTLVEKLEHDKSVPPIDKLFQNPGDVLMTNAEYADVSAVVVYDTVVSRTSETEVNMVVITEGEKPYLLTAYGDHAHFFQNSSGKKFYATNLLIKDGAFQTVADTCVTFSGEEPETRENLLNKAIKQLTVKTVGTCVDGVPVGFAEGRLFRMPTMEHRSSTIHNLLVNCFVILHRGIPHLFFEKAEKLDESTLVLTLPELEGELGKVEGRLLDRVISVEFMRKTDVSYVETKFGRRPFIRFWLKVGDKIVAGLSWGEAAKKIGEISESSKTKLAFPLIKTNKFGELEIIIDNLTAIC